MDTPPDTDTTSAPASADSGGGATIVAEASDIAEAHIWVDALRDEDIEAAFVDRGPGSAFGGATLFGSSYAVLVPRSRIGEARSVIADLGGGSALVAYRTADEERRSSRRAFLTVAGPIALVAVVAVVLRFAFG